MSGADIVKVLRAKCNDLEDEIDTATARNEELSTELAAAKAQCEERARADELQTAQMEAVQERSDALAGELAAAQASCEDADKLMKAQCDLLSSELAAERARAEALEESHTNADCTQTEENGGKEKGEKGGRDAGRGGGLESAPAETATLHKEIAELRALAAQRLSQLEAHEEQDRNHAAEATDCQRQLEQSCEERTRSESLTIDLRQTAEAHSERSRSFLAELQQEQQANDGHLKRAAEHLQECEAYAAQHSELQGNIERMSGDLKGRTEEHSRALRDIDALSSQHESERRRADELHEQLSSAGCVHEDLFTKLQVAVQEVDALKHSCKHVSSEKDDLQARLEEVSKAKKELEEAEPPGPAQLSVSDVLISVSFEGIAQPLDVRPWDTNFQDVVVKWLAFVQKSSKLQASLTRYLHHLEDSTDVFPVRLDAKLLDVHEQFAL